MPFKIFQLVQTNGLYHKAGHGYGQDKLVRPFVMIEADCVREDTHPSREAAYYHISECYRRAGGNDQSRRDDFKNLIILEIWEPTTPTTEE